MRGLGRLFSVRKRLEYRGGRPGRLARIQNRLWGWLFGVGVLGERAAVLEVRGRKSGRVISLPVAIVHYEGERYLVAMLGENTEWVRNVRAARGRACLRHGRREEVLLVEDFPAGRAEVLRRYLSVAPGARPHLPVDPGAGIEAFQQVATQYPIFMIRPPGAPRGPLQVPEPPRADTACP